MELNQQEKEQLKTLALNPAWRGMIYNAVVNNYDEMDDTAIMECVKVALRLETLLKEATK
jgi:hypothetical protein